MSDKITAHHRARKAILYIRQSSAHQVQHNLESQRLQYPMRDRLQQLGWRDIAYVVRLVDNAHAACAELCLDPVVIEELTNHVSSAERIESQEPHRNQVNGRAILASGASTDELRLCWSVPPHPPSGL